MNLLIASEAHERGYNQFGIPIAEATDPANQFAFEADPFPIIDHAAHAVGAAQKTYYDRDDKDHPMNRSGHMWSVHRKSTT